MGGIVHRRESQVEQQDMKKYALVTRQGAFQHSARRKPQPDETTDRQKEGRPGDQGAPNPDIKRRRRHHPVLTLGLGFHMPLPPRFMPPPATC